ncbi:MAG TPA: hypothetical protein VKD72_38735, partial [Gemmataceae bacterium]|nr:hypothetical protein [Gemmataceae bacterium]
MNSSDTPRAVVCSACGRPSPGGAVCCDTCGKDLTEDQTIRETRPYSGLFPPALVPADTGPVLLAENASPAAVQRLREVLDEVIDKGFNHFPGEVLWPEAGGELRQAVPPGSTSLARLLEEPPSRPGW